MGESGLPSPGGVLDAETVSNFNDTWKQLLVDNNKSVRVFFTPTGSGCPNCFIDARGKSNGIYTSGSNPFPAGQFNKPFPVGTTCPVCQGSHQIFVDDGSRTYTALLVHSPKDIEFQPVNENTNVVRTTTLACSFSDMGRANYAIIEGERMVRVKRPVRRGFDPPQFVHTVWVSQDGGVV